MLLSGMSYGICEILGGSVKLAITKNHPSQKNLTQGRKQSRMRRQQGQSAMAPLQRPDRPALQCPRFPFSIYLIRFRLSKSNRASVAIRYGKAGNRSSRNSTAGQGFKMDPVTAGFTITSAWPPEPTAWGSAYLLPKILHRVSGG